jgi:hypothetical protein
VSDPIESNTTVRRLSLFDETSQERFENEYSEKTKIEPVLEDNNESEEVNEKSYSEEFNSEEEIEELSDEDINQETEEELLDIPTFLRRQAN